MTEISFSKKQEKNPEILENHKFYPVKEYYEQLDKEYPHSIHSIRCVLCPNKCVILDGKSGLCKARINIKGKLYSTVYGHPCSISIDPIEKKPLYYFYPGEKILSFGTFGCNIFCKGCQNFDITRVQDVIKETGKLEYYSAEEIIETAKSRNIKMIAYTYNEPTIFFEYMLDIAKLARKNGIKNVIVSNGYINPKPLKELCKYIDAANIDIKGITEKFYREYSKANIKPILESIKTLRKSGVWLELTNLVIPGLNDDPKDIKKLCEWIKDNVGVNVPLHFSRFYPYYNASTTSPTPENTLEFAKEIATKTGLKYVYIGNLGFLDDTICDKCGNVLIKRSEGMIGGKVEVIGIARKEGINKSSCSKCKSIIHGEF